MICKHNLLISHIIIIIRACIIHQIIFQVLSTRNNYFQIISSLFVCLFSRTVNKHKTALKCIKTNNIATGGWRLEVWERWRQPKVLIKMFYCNSLGNLLKKTFLGLFQMYLMIVNWAFILLFRVVSSHLRKTRKISKFGFTSDIKTCCALPVFVQRKFSTHFPRFIASK